MFGVAGTINDLPASPDTDQEPPRRVDLPKSPLIVMCATFGALVLTLTVQVLFFSNDTSQRVDPVRLGESIQADQRVDSGQSDTDQPLVAYKEASWQGPIDAPGLIWQMPTTK
jgi:hypothetical protein